MLKTLIGKPLSTIRKGESGEVALLNPDDTFGDVVKAEARCAQVQANKFVMVYETPGGTFLVVPWEG